MSRTLALVLAGGRVDELSVLTLHRPKAAVFFGGLYRVIDFPLSNLMNSGIERVGILCQYRSSSLIDHVGIGASWDFVGRDRGVTLLPPQKATDDSDWYKGTTDAVYQNLEFLQEHPHDNLMILSGDHVYCMDYGPMIRYHEEKNADLTVGLVEVPREGAHRFGLAQIDDEDGHIGGRIIDYVEKPERPIYNWASMTVYLFRPEVLIDLIKDQAARGSSWEFGRDLLPRMVESHRVYGYRHRGYWAYSRTIDEYWRSNMDFLDNGAALGFNDWQIRTNLDDKNLRDRPPAYIGEGASVKGSRITFGCRIEGSVERSILFPGVTVEKGASVRDSILFPDVSVGANSQLNMVIADEKVRVGPAARIGYSNDLTPNRAFPDLLSTGITLIGKESHLPDKIEIGRNCIVPPFLEPDHFSESSYPSGVLLT